MDTIILFIAMGCIFLCGFLGGAILGYMVGKDEES